jgi:hypothetical protein
MRLPIDVVTVQNIHLARRLFDLGMMPKLINDFIPGTKKLVRAFGPQNNEFSFSRGYSRQWVKSSEGFKLSNILFKIYGIVSGDPSLKKGINLIHVATSWELAVVQYPQLLSNKVCDISRFAYLIQKVISNEFLVCDCKSRKCNKKFIMHEDSDNFFCWACAENYSSHQLKKLTRSLSADGKLMRETKYAPKYRSDKDSFDSQVYLSASRCLFKAKKLTSEHADEIESSRPKRVVHS